MAAFSSVVLCFEKQKLIRAFEWAVSEYNRMNTAQAVALRNGEGFKFSEQIAQAAIRKDDAKYAVLKHQEEHHC